MFLFTINLNELMVEILKVTSDFMSGGFKLEILGPLPSPHAYASGWSDVLCGGGPLI